MKLGDDTAASLYAAVDLINSAGPPEELTGHPWIDAWYQRHVYTGRRDRDAHELQAVLALRPALRALLLADRDVAAAMVNTLLDGPDVRPRVVRHGDVDWHIHAVRPDAPLDRRVAIETAMATIDLIRLNELDRISVCIDEQCSGLVVDLTRNRSRRYCSRTCANRNAVANYRDRKARRQAASFRPGSRSP